MEREVFSGLVKRSKAAESLRADGQSYLLCSGDTDALMLFTEHLISLSEGQSNNSHNIDGNTDDLSDKNGEKSDNRSKSNMSFFGENGVLSLPDVRILPAGENVLVSDIEMLTNSAATTPLALSYKYYIIKNAHTASDSAANKLLKTLEEPPKSIKIIIHADSEYDVLPTVRSRCRVINLPPFSDDMLENAANKAYADSPFLDKAKRLALGSITRLKKVAGGEFEDIENTVFSALTGMKTSADVAKYSHALSKKKDSLADIIDMFSLVFSDTYRLSYDLPTVFAYRRPELEQIAEFYSVNTALRLAPVHKRALTRLKFNGNAASVIDEYLFSLLEIRQKCK